MRREARRTAVAALLTAVVFSGGVFAAATHVPSPSAAPPPATSREPRPPVTAPLPHAARPPATPRPRTAPHPDLDAARARTAWSTGQGTLRAAGFAPGAAVDAEDLLRAAAALGVRVGRTLDPADTARIVAAARRRAAPALWAVGADFGKTVDDDDLVRAAHALGLRVGASLDLEDIDRIVVAAQQGLLQVASEDVVPGLEYGRWHARLPDGVAVVHTLRWVLSDPRVALRAELTDRFGRKGTVPAVAARRASSGAVAVVNGGFWDFGDVPDGLMVSAGQLLSDPNIGKPWVRGQRGAFAILNNGYVVGRPRWEAEVVSRVGRWTLGGVNRPLRADDVVVYTPAWGASTRTAAGTVELTVDDVHLATHLEETRVVAAAGRGGDAAIPAEGIVVAASGKAASGLAALRPGEALTLRTDAGEWTDIGEALAAGPLLITGAERTGVEAWQEEGFGPRHNARRHPRTAMAFTPEGEAFLVVVDGRQPGYSVGMTTAETAALLRAFGARDAVMLDGGGSSHMVVRGRTVNRPCCDARPRPVPTALVLYRRGS